MALTDAPEVRIDNTILAPRWSLTTPIALGGLAITWGRRSHLDPAEPASLQFEVLDTDGQIASTAAMNGRRVSVRRADDGYIIFRGRIDDFTIDHVVVVDPDTNRRRRVWRFKITAYDNLAELAKARPAGPGNEPILSSEIGPDHWPLNSPAGRISDLAAATDIVDGIQWSNPWPTGEMYPYALPIGQGDGRSLLSLIEGMYNIVPLGYVRHDPHSNMLSVGKPTTTAGLELTWDGDTIGVDLPTGQVIPARTVAMPNGYRAGTGQSEAVDIVQVVSPRLGESSGTVEIVTARTTARYDPAATGRRELRRQNDVMHSIRAVSTTSFSWPFPVAYVTSEFGVRGSGFHEGMDFSGGPAVSGASIPAAGDGTVVTNVANHSGWGNYIVLDHGDVDGKNLRTLYAHMITQSPLAVGTQVARGQTVGQVGSTGNSTGPHLHLETRVDGAPINPRVFMSTYGTGSGPTPDAGIWQANSAAETAAMMNQLNDKIVLPTIRLDWRHFSYPAAVTQHLLSAVAKAVALYFPGSVFGPVYDAATEHQVIGGRLVYYKGWTLDAILAPAIRTRAGITVDELVTINEPTVADYDPDLTLADLGNVTKGVTA